MRVLTFAALVGGLLAGITAVAADKDAALLEALEGLPCGCVAAAFRARPWDVAVVSLEAKGPHCILAGHTSGQVLRLGDPSEFDEDEDDE